MRRVILSFMLLLLLFGVIQSLAHPQFLIEELHYHYELFDLRGLAKGTIFLFSYLLATLFFLIVIAIKSKPIFYMALFLLFLSLVIDFFVQFLGVSHGFSISEYRLALNETSNYQFLFAYATNIGKSILLSLIVVWILYIIRKKVLKIRFSNWTIVLLFIPLVFISMVTHRVDTFKLSSYPSLIKIPLIAVENNRISAPLRRRVLSKDITPIDEGRFKNIIWIIDESVTGTYLSINGYQKDTTPYLTKLDKNSSIISNFGVVNSISNCSGKSNLFLRIGMVPKSKQHIKEEMFKLPTIFQYAKRAGYTTWLFDSQTQKDHLQDYLTLYDKESIDNFKTLGTDVPRYKKDSTLLDRVAQITHKSGSRKNFIVVVKYGSHFPYFTSYNHKYSPFQPTVEVAYGGMDMEHKEQMVNTYLNSIYSSVDLYLKEMVKKVNFENSVVFYTSDHGQNILETKNLTRTHCNTEIVVKNEVSVPLFVFTKDAKKRFPVDRDKFYSQIQIFPTILSLFGYNKSIIEPYGDTLYRGFNSSEDREYILSSSLDKKIYK